MAQYKKAGNKRYSLQVPQIRSKEQHIVSPGSNVSNKTLFFQNKHHMTLESNVNMFPPIDIFMTPSFIGGKATHGKPLTVFTQEINPKYKVTHKEKGEEVYGYDDFNEKEGYKDNLRNFDRSHGLAYFYTKNRLIKADINSIKKETNSIQMLVCVTMYGEPRAFLENTLSSIASNLPQFAKMGISQKQIVVVVLQDGIMKMKEEMVEFYSEQDKFLDRKYYLNERRFMIDQQINYLKLQKKEQSVRFNNGLPTTVPTKTALLYQNEICFNKQDKLVTFSVFKHLNGKKLSSHLWFFEGFCRQFQPKYCALVDVGTLPASDGLVYMYKALEGDAKIGGVCGFMGLKAPVIQKSELSEEQQNEIKDMINNQISEYKKQHFWIDQEYEKKQKEEKLRKIQQQPSRGSKKMSLVQLRTAQYGGLKKSESNVTDILAEQLRIEKRKREYTTDLIIIFNVFFLLQSIFLLVSGIVVWVVSSICRVFVWMLKSYLDLASLPQAQNYEYTTAHMIDKNFESALGFLHVLPGAWSAYRYQALNISKENRENLIQKRYLKQIMYSELMTNSIQELNMFLAEDRILCLGIYCQIQSNYYLKFVPDAKAFTDPVDKFEEFLNQRRRWINSSWFALNYVLQNYEFHVEESSHSEFSKKFVLPLNMTFAQISKWTTYFIPALYLFVSILSSYQFLQPSVTQSYTMITSKDQYDKINSLKCKQLEEEPTPMCNGTTQKVNCYILCVSYQVPNIFFTLLNFVPAVFIIVILMIIFASLIFKAKDVEISEDEEKMVAELNSKVKKGIPISAERKKLRNEIQNKMSQQFQNDVFKVLASIISITSLIVVIIVTATIFFNAMNDSYGVITGFKKLKREFLIYIYVMIGLNYGSFYLSMLVHLRQPFIVWNVIKSFLSYQIYSPVYNHILMIFSFCNIDDATWGTKGLTGSSGISKQFTEKIEFVGKWIILNVFLLTALLIANLVNSSTPVVIMGLGAFGSIYFFIKTMIGIFHYSKYFYYDKIMYWHRNKGNKIFYDEYSRQLESLYNKTLNINAMVQYQTPQQNIQKDMYSEEIDDDDDDNDDESNPMTPQNDQVDHNFAPDTQLTEAATKHSPKHDPDDLTYDNTGKLVKLSGFAGPAASNQPQRVRELKRLDSKVCEEMPTQEEEHEDSIRIHIQKKQHSRFPSESYFASRNQISRQGTANSIDMLNTVPILGPRLQVSNNEDTAGIMSDESHTKTKFSYPYKKESDEQYVPSNFDSFSESERPKLFEKPIKPTINGFMMESNSTLHHKESERQNTHVETLKTIEDVEVEHVQPMTVKKQNLEMLDQKKESSESKKKKKKSGSKSRSSSKKKK